MVSSAKAVQVPESAADPKGNDLLDPLHTLLQGINVLGDSKDGTGGAFSSPDQAVAIIESGATGLTKVWAGVLSALGGATAVTTAATGFWNGQKGATRVALVATTGAVVAAVVVALAVIIAADVIARAVGARSIYEARARIATRFVEVAATASAPPAIRPAVAGATPGDPAAKAPGGAGASAPSSTVSLAQKTSVEISGVKDFVAHAVTTTADGKVATILVERPGAALEWVEAPKVTAVDPPKPPAS